MKKRILVQTAALTLLMAVGSASANEPVSDMPIDAGIVIDVSGGEKAPEPEAKTTDAVGQTNVNDLVTQQGEEEAAANDGTVLPLDQGEVNTPDVDAGTPDLEVEAEQPEVTAPVEDTVVLTENEPVVEPLAQTGIEDKGIMYAGIGAVVGLFGLIFSRRFKADAEGN